MSPIDVERHENVVTVTTDTKKRMYAIIHLAVPAGFDPSDFELSRAGAHSWRLTFERARTAHRFKRLLDEAERLIQHEGPGQHA
jgi:tRNA(Leu) C34 or U34 (ribose-2'-O)-methylase TrmL